MDIYIGKGGLVSGPYDPDEIRQRLDEGRLDGTELAWHEGLDEWLNVKEVLEDEAPAPAPPVVPCQGLLPASVAEETPDEPTEEPEPLDDETRKRVRQIKDVIASGNPDAAWQLVRTLNNLCLYEALLADCPVDDDGWFVPEGLSVAGLDFYRLLAVGISEEVQAKLKLNPLTSLYLQNYDITDLSPLAKWGNLSRLWLSGETDYYNPLDLTPLVELEDLTELRITDYDYESRWSVLPDLTLLTNLKSLWVVGTGIRDLAGLGELKDLAELDLSGNLITDVSTLAELTQLTQLNLGGNPITDVSALAGLTQLKKLVLSTRGRGYYNYYHPTKFPNPASLSELTQLEELDLSGNLITDLSDLSGLTQLVSLDLSSNQIADVGVLVKLNQLKELNLSHNPELTLDKVETLHEALPNCEIRHNAVISEVIQIKALIQVGHTQIAWELVQQSLNDPRLYEGLLNDCPVSEDGWIRVPGYLADYIDFFIKLLANIPESALEQSELNPPTQLNLGSSEIRDSDIRSLAGLTQLTQLNLSDNEITDVSALADLTELTVLSLNGNQITDVSALAGLTQLTDLHLSNNQITDVSALAGLTQLQELNLQNNQVDDVSALAELTQITEIGLRNNEITDVSDLAELTHLTDLDLGNNQITDVNALAELTQLTELNLNNNEITDVSALAELSQLTELNLNYNQITDVSALAGLTELTGLYLLNNEITDVNGLAELTQLTVLILWNNEITDVGALAGLTQLRRLDLDGLQINDVSPLLNLTNLEWLDLGNNEVITPVDIWTLQAALVGCDISPEPWQPTGSQADIEKIEEAIRQEIGKEYGFLTIDDVSSVYSLDLSGLQITDLTPLEDLGALEYLDLSGNEITDLSPLHHLWYLYELYLRDNPDLTLAQISNLEYCLEDEGVEIYHNATK